MAKLQFDVTEELEEQLRELFIASAREVLNEVSKQEINSKEFLNYREACEFVGIAHNTLKIWINDYKLKTITIGGRKMIHKQTLVLFLKNYER